MKMLKLSSKLGEFLIQATQSTNFEIALKEILSEYLVLKVKDLDKEIENFETKWNMSFDEFREKCREGKIDQDIFSYNVEKDFWGWEKAETLKKHYESMRSQWT
jgi:hypothetical protein